MKNSNATGLTSFSVYVLLVIAAATTVTVPAVTDTLWTAAEVVSTASAQDSETVSMAVDNEGTVHLAWSDATDVGGSGEDRDILYRKRYLDGTWSLTEVVSAASSLDSHTPSIGVDGSGTVYVAWVEDFAARYEENGDIFFTMKTSTGDWAPAELVSIPGGSGLLFSETPSLAVDVSGNVHLAWGYLEWSTLETNVNYRMRTTDGLWTEIENLSQAYYGGASPYLVVTADSTAHLVWVEEYWGGRVRYQSKPIGGSWSTAEVVSPGEDMIFHTFLAVAPDNSLHVVWDDYTDSGWGLVYSIKPVGGQWSVREIVDSADLDPRYSVAVGKDGRVHLAWSDNQFGDWDILYKIREESGWTATDIISTESTDYSRWPRLVFDHRGILHASWHDSTDYNGAGPDNDIFYKQNPAPTGTVSAELSCVPGSGTVPFTINIRATLSNTYALFKRRIAARMDVDMGGGRHYGSWRAGYTQLDPGESYVRAWNQIIPAFVTALGTNVFSFIVEDVTPQPYNQPPYAAAGDTDTASCSVEAAAP